MAVSRVKKGPRKINYKQKETYEDFIFDELNVYAGIDCIATLDLLRALFPKLIAKPKYRNVCANDVTEGNAPDILTELLEVKTLALEFTCDLKITGMFYDQEANSQMGERMRQDMDDTKQRIDLLAGMDVPLSGGAFYNYLYRTKGYCSVVKTKTGDEATSGEALEALAEIYEDDRELLFDIKRFIDVRAMYNGFIDGYIEKFVKHDSRIHCDYLLHGTKSHRLSSQNPNMLNMSRGYYDYNTRNNYVATPGYSMVAIDFSSCECKILAALSGDEAMIDACRKGYDFHSFTASMMSGMSYEEFVSRKHEPALNLMRQNAKATTFGLLYGSSVGGIAHTLGITPAEAQIIIDAYFDKFPQVKSWIFDQHKHAMLNQYIYTNFGQRVQCQGARQVFKGSAAYNASMRLSQNSGIQSPASTFGLVCFAMYNKALRERGLGRAVLTVYDSIEVEIGRASCRERV